MSNIETAGKRPFASLDEIAGSFQSVPFTDTFEYERYGTVGATEEEKVARQKALGAFMDGEGDWMTNEYPLIRLSKIDEEEIAYQGLLAQIENTEASLGGETPESAALYEQVARKLAEVYRQKEAHRSSTFYTHEKEEMLEDSVVAEESQPAKKLKQSRERAGAMSQELHGEIDRPAFCALLSKRLETVLAARNQDDPRKMELAGEYLQILGMNEEEARSFTVRAPELTEYERTEEIDAKLKAALYEIYPNLETAMNFHRSQDNLKASEAKPAFDAALDAVGLLARGWTSRVIPGSKIGAKEGTIKTKEIIWGENRSDFDKWKRVETPVHEAFHCVRAQNAADQADPLLQQPMSGSKHFEEGFVDALAQLVSGRRTLIGSVHYVNQGLLYGKDKNDDNKLVRTARDIYELEWRLRALSQVGELTEEALAAHAEAARPGTYRATRGGPDSTDISYFEGSRKANLWLNSIAQLPHTQMVEELRWALSCVFDPTDEEQARLVPRTTSQKDQYAQ